MNEYVEQLQARLKELGIFESRMISLSKNRYSERYPKHLVIFNANIRFLWTNLYIDHKVRMCDIDLTLEGRKLQALATEFGCYILVSHEADIDWMWPSAIYVPKKLTRRQRQEKARKLVEKDKEADNNA